MGDIFPQLLLEGMHRVANVGHCALSLKLRLTVTGDLTASEECTEPVIGTADTVIQDDIRRIRSRKIWAYVDTLVPQLFDDTDHPVEGTVLKYRKSSGAICIGKPPL